MIVNLEKLIQFIKTLMKNINYFNIRNYFKYDLISNFFLFKYYDNKIRTTLRNSYFSNKLMNTSFKKSLNYDKIRKSLFKNNLIKYSDDKESDWIKDKLRSTFSETVNDYIKYADEIIYNHFTIFNKRYHFKNDVNWHYSFINNYQWNLKESEKIEIHPKNKNIDIKFVWELNRHQFLLYLGIAYFINKDERYAFKFRDLILNWIKKNPPLYGVNWISPLEVSIRLTSWILTILFFKDSKEINNNDFFNKFFKSLFEHVYFLKYYYYRRAFNHTICDLFGLYFFSKIFHDIPILKKWEKRYYKRFKKQILLQVRKDGTHIEQSVNYHRFVLEIFTFFIILNQNELSKQERLLIKKMFDFLVYTIKPNNKLPSIGDSDDAKFLLLTFYDNKSCFELFNFGAMIFNIRYLKYISEEILSPSILLLGSKGYQAYEDLKSNSPPCKFKYFEDSGFISIRNNWSRESNYLFVDFSKFGPQDAGHSHSDITNFIYTFKGKDIIIDSGTFSYNHSMKKRNYFRSSIAHNILTINKKNQAKMQNWFGWLSKPKIKRHVSVKNDNIILTCIHNGFKGFLIKRKIITNKSLESLIIEDLVFYQDKNSNKSYEIDIYYHFADNVNIYFKKDNKIIIDDELIIKVASKQEFSLNFIKGYYSPNYGSILQNQVLNIHSEYLFQKKKEFKIITEIRALN